MTPKEQANKIIEDYGYVDLVTSQNVLAHVKNLRETFENIYKGDKKQQKKYIDRGYLVIKNPPIYPVTENK